MRERFGAMGQPAIGAAVSAAALAALTAVLAPLVGEGQITNIALTYLVLTLIVSAVWGLRIGLPTAVAADVLVNFFYVPPLHRFTVHRAENVVTLVLFLFVAAAGSVMFELLRRNLRRAEQREAEISALLEASRVLARNESPRVTLDSLCVVIARAVGARGCSIIGTEPLEVVGATYDEASGRAPSRDESAVITEVMRRGESIRMRDDQRTVRSMFVPLRGTTPGVLRLAGPLRPPRGIALSDILPGLLDEASVALDRAGLVQQSERASVLARSEEMKSVLLSGVSHDLRSPLTAIKAAVSNLRDPAVTWPDEDQRAFLETIESQTDRLTRTVANLLEMSRLEAGVTAHPEPIELEPLAEELALTNAGDGASHPLRTSIPGGTWIRGDYGLVFQALSNLLENAEKYSPPGSSIELSAETRPGRVFIRVTDHGPGIPQADLPYVFEKFYRGAATSAVKGSGLGLALAKAMIEACRGTISVESSPAGTTFEISLPAATEPHR